MSVFQFILASLACYRLTVLITRDAGPLSVFANMRKLPGKFMSCPYCVSVWAAAVIESAFLFCGVIDSPVVIACIIFAMSGITIALDRIFTADYRAQ